MFFEVDFRNGLRLFQWLKLKGKAEDARTVLLMTRAGGTPWRVTRVPTVGRLDAQLLRVLTDSLQGIPRHHSGLQTLRPGSSQSMTDRYRKAHLRTTQEDGSSDWVWSLPWDCDCLVLCHSASQLNFSLCPALHPYLHFHSDYSLTNTLHAKLF